MYCGHCGEKIEGQVKFCPNCGQSIETQRSEQGGNLGYSSKINDPRFEKYLAKTGKWSMVFTFVIALIAIAGFYVAGEKDGSELSNPEALYIGLVIGGLFFFIGFSSNLKRKRSKTWDGIVIDKTAKKKRKNVGNGEDSYVKRYIDYTVVIQAENKKKYKIKVADNPLYYNYYKIGDKVRHHAGLNTYEKYDKRSDDIIFCNACSRKCDIQEEECPKCHCPLLK